MTVVCPGVYPYRCSSPSSDALIAEIIYALFAEIIYALFAEIECAPCRDETDSPPRSHALRCRCRHRRTLVGPLLCPPARACTSPASQSRCVSREEGWGCGVWGVGARPRDSNQHWPRKQRVKPVSQTNLPSALLVVTSDQRHARSW